ncbi:glutamate-cysteine ligase family protein [Streptacidiphilus monticola]
MGQRMTEDEAEAHIHGVCFKTGPPGRVGVELEWLVRDPARPGSCPPLRRTAGLVAGDRLAHGGRLSHEPGGQLELSSSPADGPAACIRRTAAELEQLRAALRARGLVVEGNGLEPFRDPPRLLEYPGTGRWSGTSTGWTGPAAGAG